MIPLPSFLLWLKAVPIFNYTKLDQDIIGKLEDKDKVDT